MARASKLTAEQKAEIIRLNQEEKAPYGALAVRFGVSTATIMRICRPDYYERQKESNRKYQAQNQAQIAEQKKLQTKGYYLSFHVENDSEVISYLDNLDNTQDYVRQKVLEDIDKQKNTEGPEN